ncbi:unnamed protein product, partial [Vitis vinifera]
MKINPSNIGTTESAAEVFFGPEPGQEVSGEIIGLSVSTSSSSVFINVKNRGLFAYSLDGHLRWSAGPVLYRFGYRQGCKQNVKDCYFSSIPVIDRCEASIYMSNTEGEIYSLSVRSPQFKWIQDFSSFDKVFTITPGNNGCLYVTVPVRVLVLALDVTTGNILWQRNTGPLSTTECAPVVDSNGWISIGSLDGFLYSFSPTGSLKKFPRAAVLDSVVQVSPLLDCSGYAVYISQTEMEEKISHVTGEYTCISALKPRNVVFTMLAPSTGSTYWSESYPGKFSSLLVETDLQNFVLDESVLLAFVAASKIGNPLPCRTTYQKLAASCSEARPKYLSIYTGNERAILLFLLFESAVLVLLAGLVRFCCIFWRKKKLQGQDLGKFLEKRHSLRLQKKEFDRTITELEKKAAEEASTSAVLEKLGDLVQEREGIQRKLSTTYSLGRDVTGLHRKTLLPLYDGKTRSYSFQGAKKESVTIFHTVSDASSGESYSDREISWHSFEDKEGDPCLQQTRKRNLVILIFNQLEGILIFNLSLFQLFLRFFLQNPNLLPTKFLQIFSQIQSAFGLASRFVAEISVIFVVLLPQKLLLDSDMGTEELINPPAPSGSVCGSEDNELHNSNPEPGEADSSSSNSEVKEDKLNIESLMQNKVDFEKVDSRLTPGVVLDKDLVDKQLTSQGSVEVTETIVVTKLINSSSSGVPTENGCLTAPDEGPIGNHMIDGTSISGVKRARLTIDEQQPSVHVIYNSLTRDSKRKLEELLQQWSEWHAKYVSSSHDPKGQLDSGEKTYFPALHVGLNKSSAVSFWVDNQTRKQQDKEFISLDGDSVPLYDRGFALGLVSEDGQSKPEGALEIIDASRCFNCGSYNHSMKECPKPRDNVAVNNARKQHKSRRNQNPGSRNPTRYYQNSPGGRYDGLRPGALGVETRELLGLGELDPPPWLNRMREMGYPPGYLDPEEEEQPSGITIYADEEVKDEQEDGEILETEYLEPQRKMSVEFPGINAPIPKNADERRWAAGSRPHRRLNHSYEPSSRRNSHEQRHGGIDSSYTSYSTRGNIPRPRSPNFGRSLSDRGGRSSLVHEDSLGYNSYSSLSYSSSSSRLSPHNYGSASYENNIDDRWNGSSSWSNKDRHRHDEHRYHKNNEKCLCITLNLNFSFIIISPPIVHVIRI